MLRDASRQEAKAAAENPKQRPLHSPMSFWLATFEAMIRESKQFYDTDASLPAFQLPRERDYEQPTVLKKRG